jgi:sugar phosphate isomerase/epimerase
VLDLTLFLVILIFEEFLMYSKKDYIITESGCHEWIHSCSGAGYAQRTINGVYWSMHRYVYMKEKGELLSNEIVRHMCHNRKCINPDHLEKGTHLDNWRDSIGLHIEVAKSRRKIWTVCGVSYENLRDASRLTGISQSTLRKYTKDGVFDVFGYRAGCIVANVKPRV